MYTFVIKNIAGVIVHTGIVRKNTVSGAQLAGDSFLSISRLMQSRASITQKGNYIDVISV